MYLVPFQRDMPETHILFQLHCLKAPQTLLEVHQIAWHSLLKILSGGEVLSFREDLSL